ncbi:hypothetical protein GO755_39090 [Spirosoma sp. HMF4905]|uniref:Uncharacterized protein n=1 Tax=Spirosoma arboris TaxID=2682092 RepID=A0A7K1SQK0_9BACT|nr:hypothetical protein [Spirosoma arboris]MVM36085.1 hypothetical protein [Spirosoma arboris]
MPGTSFTSPFDLTFDSTFQGLINTSADIAADDCRLPGVYLHWLSNRGWCSFLFRGNSEEDFDAKSNGTIEQAGLITDIQRQGTPTILARAGSLTKAQAAVIRSLFISPRVYALAPGSDGKIKACPVRVDEGTYPVNRDASPLMRIEVKISFPKLTGQRA